MFQAESAGNNGGLCERVDRIQIAIQECLIIWLHISVQDENPLGLSKLKQAVARMAAAEFRGDAIRRAGPG